LGLSRNKVAVSEGAAGSPPFYGESKAALRSCPVRKQRAVEERQEYMYKKFL